MSGRKDAAPRLVRQPSGANRKFGDHGMEVLTCNFLMPLENVDETSVPQEAMRWGRHLGNWVGGSVAIDNENITFRMNAMNAKFQKDTRDVVIQRRQIETIAEGNLLRFFRTVDIKANGRVFRFRLMSKRQKQFLGLLNQIQ